MSRVLVLGGARSGKSTYAEGLLASSLAVDYVATAPDRPGDAEWAERVRLHRQRRPPTWTTLEAPDLPELLSVPGADTLIDCVGVWLTTAMDEAGCWDNTEGSTEELAARCAALVSSYRVTTRTVIAVSNEVGMGVVPASASGRRFRDELGRLNMALAAASDEVWLVVAGIAMRVK